MYLKKFMEEVLDAAEDSVDEVPVAALIVHKSGEILSKSTNLMLRNCDPTAHAEMIAIRKACEKLGSRYLTDCSIYISLEPCAMCAAAISYARIKNVYYSVADLKFGAVESNFHLYNNNSRLFKPECLGGFDELRGKKIISNFFIDKRS